MKSLEQIKNEYARDRKMKSWENFCEVANDNMFARAVDEIAALYAECRLQLALSRKLILQPIANQPADRWG